MCSKLVNLIRYIARQRATWNHQFSFECKWGVRLPLPGKISGTVPQKGVLDMVTDFTDKNFNFKVCILNIQHLFQIKMTLYFLLVSVGGGMGSVRPESTPKHSGSLVGGQTHTLTGFTSQHRSLTELHWKDLSALVLFHGLEVQFHREGITTQHAISAGCHESQVAGHPPERLHKFWLIFKINTRQ